MTPTYEAVHAPLADQAGGGRDQPVCRQVRNLLAQMHPNRTRLERRKDLRHPYPFLVEITPVDLDGVTPLGETLTVVGKDLTDRGIGFFHQEPLPFRRAIVSFESGTGFALSVLIDLSWCRFNAARVVRQRRAFSATGPVRSDRANRIARECVALGARNSRFLTNHFFGGSWPTKHTKVMNNNS